jgi:hypothetical protein
MLAASSEPIRIFRGGPGTIVGCSSTKAQIHESLPASTCGSH